MKPELQLKVELGISAQRIVSNYLSNNQQLDEVIQSSIEGAMDKIIENGGLAAVIEAQFIKDIEQAVKSATHEFYVKRALQEKIAKAIESKIDELAESWANTALQNLTNP